MGAGEPIRILLADDQVLFREGLRTLLSVQPDFVVVGEAGDGAAAIEGVQETHPSAVLLDLSMPGMDGLEAIPEIRRGRPDVAIIILSGFSASRMERSKAGKRKGRAYA